MGPLVTGCPRSLAAVCGAYFAFGTSKVGHAIIGAGDLMQPMKPLSTEATATVTQGMYCSVSTHGMGMML